MLWLPESPTTSKASSKWDAAWWNNQSPLLSWLTIARFPALSASLECGACPLPLEGKRMTILTQWTNRAAPLCKWIHPHSSDCPHPNLGRPQRKIQCAKCWRPTPKHQWLDCKDDDQERAAEHHLEEPNSIPRLCLCLVFIIIHWVILQSWWYDYVQRNSRKELFLCL